MNKNLNAALSGGIAGKYKFFATSGMLNFSHLGVARVKYKVRIFSLSQKSDSPVSCEMVYCEMVYCTFKELKIDHSWWFSDGFSGSTRGRKVCMSISEPHNQH